ncbi:MAG: hypothetical protein FIB08_05280 [Candidatus Methanoperedens sp.]|nr:hypothetical protein [Candidatus Methanoperedens sp.]
MQPANSGKNNVSGFDFTGSMKMLVGDIVKTHPDFSHIALESIFIAISPSNRRRDGVVAKLRPLRYEGGSKTQICRGTKYTSPEIQIKGNDILYIVYFHLPRFLNHGDHRDKLETVLHELYHISPLFNGDIRRFPGKNYAHGNSRKSYNRLISTYTDEYINSTTRPELSIFLKYGYSGLKRKYGAIYGDIIRVPRSKPAR